MSHSPTPVARTTLQVALANKRAIAYCLFACISTFSLGFDASMLLPLPQFLRQFGYEYHDQYVVPAAHQAIWGVVLIPGSLAGAAITGPINKLLGRKHIFTIGSVIFAVGVLQLQISNDWKTFAAGKFFHYIGITLYTIGAQTYISEVTPPGIRGVMLALLNLSTYIGLFITSCILQGVQNIPSNLSFRIPIILQYTIPFILFTCTWFIPESPYWLFENRGSDAAKESLRRLHGGKHDLDQHLRDIENTNKQRKTSNANYLDCFKGSDLRRTMIAVGVLVGQQFVGSIFVLGYVTYFFILSGVGQSEAFTITAVMFGLQILANIISWFLIENFGRRFLLLTGTSVMLISLFIIGGAGLGSNSAYPLGSLPKLVVSFMVIYSLFFQLSLGTAGWAVASEVSSPVLRGLTQAIGVAANYMSAAVISITLPYMMNPDQANMGPKVCLVYGSFTFFILLFLYFAVPEMKGRTYEELNYMFEHRVATREFNGYIINSVNNQHTGSNGETADIELVG